MDTGDCPVVSEGAQNEKWNPSFAVSLFGFGSCSSLSNRALRVLYSSTKSHDEVRFLVHLLLLRLAA